jgi:hypothetical protein
MRCSKRRWAALVSSLDCKMSLRLHTVLWLLEAEMYVGSVFNYLLSFTQFFNQSSSSHI